MEAPVPSGTTEAKIVVVTEDGDTNQKQPQSSSSAADGVSPSLHVREDREEVVARASRLAEELATQWQGGFTLSAPRVRPQPGAADPFTFYTAVLRRPRLVLAPMVDMSELPFRMLCRKYGAELCYTPMYHSRLFAEEAKYRQMEFSTCPEDRPLVVQFCGNDPEVLLKAAKFVENDCDAVDLNLGCPQGIAKRGNYGSFLLDKCYWPLLYAMVRKLYENLKVPVFCKIRLLPSLDDTLQLARMLQDAGCQLLAVHGRTRDNKGLYCTPADWDSIRIVKEALAIPVIANGNIAQFEDIEPCLEATRCEGVMAAWAALNNPALFSGQVPDKVALAIEYLDMCEAYPTQPKSIRAHLCKLLKKQFQIHEDLRERMLTHTKTLPAIRTLVETLKHRLDNDIPPVLRPPKEQIEEVDDGEAMEGGALFAQDDDEF
ncbi:tRNAdihydrouridine synthase 1-like protein [Acanthamoeba castellanii str. Neff]|uniref:tRNA-dihydrouridine(16/17) synthase [NAD(P)(+)] n=1 Tax=Acanthamoeba castellanii (strain ATCC 30010 / Neff) TaxID=1257118 RepID=L8GJ81_ACACF|nr:tRNAdihydrouridine synthase 1-like protein [Acanthamoeba castellanii str. Neff]ELR12909.1 tRNAdihydrouridine synthase 1-like protein [Acanthamoeba castellanii str. Neff]